MRKLLRDQGNIYEKVTRLRHELDEVQTALDRDPSSVTLGEEEGAYLTAYTRALLDEESYTNFIGMNSNVTELNVEELFPKKLDYSKALSMIREVTNKEVKDAMFSIGNIKPRVLMGIPLFSLRKFGMLWRMMCVRR
ncbi:hypothetical protein Tco_0663191 [Tanacetum coccineum]